jgi:2-dehydro-3-deoxygluconokinase
VIVKLGEKGAFVKTKEDSFIVPGFKVEKVVDTVGAGDGFAVGVISGLLEGLSLKDAVRRGNAVGALAVMSPGDNDGLPNPDQLKNYMNSQLVLRQL